MIWMIGILAAASPYTIKSCPTVSVCTLNTLCRPGIMTTPVISTMPSRNAPMSHLLLTTFFVNTTGRSDLQLNPWNSLAEQSVANAIVIPSSSFSPW